MITDIKELSKYRNEIGAKALRLGELSLRGYNVPPFIVIKASTIDAFYRENSTIGELKKFDLADEIISKFPQEKYAVRSAAISEDTESSSQAGQFLTKLSVTKENLASAIIAVLKDAHTKLPSNNNAFSLIVQKFIDPDIAGVLFTKNPNLGLDMVLEYREGTGEKVVGGDTVKSITYLPHKSLLHQKSFKKIVELSSFAIEIEKMYGFPQDIEWAIKGEEIFILQTRPITSISAREWRGLQRIQKMIQSKDAFHFERTSLSETFPSPRPLAYSMLLYLYQKEGAIESAYKKIGVTYATNNHLKQFGNIVYVDKEIETKNLFPSYGHLRHNSREPTFETMSGLLATISNLYKFSFLSTKSTRALQTEIAKLLSQKLSEGASLKDRLSLLQSAYSEIFLVNILSQKALRQLEKHLAGDLNLLPQLLRTNSTLTSTAYFDFRSLQGNTVNIDDRSPFTDMSSQHAPCATLEETTDWFNTLPEWKKNGLTPYINNAQSFISLRESARILSVRLVSYIRNSIEITGSTLFPSEPDLIYFATLDEILSETITHKQCSERRTLYRENMELDFPITISTILQSEQKNDSCVGISAGQAKGEVVDTETIYSTKTDAILYTDTLSPDLVQYFSRIKGIVSNQGGLLSHLAIMAREFGIPVVVTNNAKKIAIGTSISMNGSSGDIKEL